MNEGQGCAAVLMGCAVGIVIYAAIYIFCCWALSKLGAKFNVGPTWGYYVPIYNLVLLCQCAQITPLWVIGFILPLVNLVAGAYLFGTIAARLGKDFWLWGIICALLGIPVFFLALDSSQPVENPNIPNFG